MDSDKAYKNKISEIQNLVANKADNKVIQHAQKELENMNALSSLPRSRVNLRNMLGVGK